MMAAIPSALACGDIPCMFSGVLLRNLCENCAVIRLSRCVPYSFTCCLSAWFRSGRVRVGCGIHGGVNLMGSMSVSVIQIGR